METALRLFGSLIVLIGGIFAVPATAPQPVVTHRQPDQPAWVQGANQVGDVLHASTALTSTSQLIHLAANPEAEPQVATPFKPSVNNSSPQLITPSAVFPTWAALGPAPIPSGQTQGTSVAVTGRITAIAVHPTNPDIVYIGAAQGGVWRTTDGGATWTPILDSAQTLAIGAIAIAPSQPSTIYVGTGEANLSGDSYFGVGVYRIDTADTVPVVNGPYNQDGSSSNVLNRNSISRIVVDPTDAATIWVGTTFGIAGIGAVFLPTNPAPPRGLYRSTNATMPSPTFTQLTIGGVSNENVTDVALEPGNPDHLLAAVRDYSGSTGGVYRTINARAVTPTFAKTLTVAASSRTALTANNVRSVVTVIAATGDNNGTLYKSTDGGQTWSGALSGGSGFCGDQCFYDIAVALDPTDATVVYLAGSAPGNVQHPNSSIMEKSTDGGTSFTTNDGTLHADSHAVVVAPSNSSIVFTGNDGGVWRSTDGGTTWTQRNDGGLSATQFQGLDVHPTDANFTLGGTQDNGTELQKPDGSWNHADNGDGGYSVIDQNATDTTNVTMYHTYFNQRNSQIGFSRATTGANTTPSDWTFLGCTGSNGNGITCADDVLFYAPLVRGPGNPNTIYFGTDRLYRSTNNGDTNVVVSQAPFMSGNGNAPGGNFRVSTIGISPQNDNVRVVGLENGRLFATTTGSSTLADITGPWPQTYVGRVVVDPTNSNTAYVALAGFTGPLIGNSVVGNVWVTTNLSAATPTWTNIGQNGLPDLPVNAFAVDPANNQSLVAGTDRGVYRSLNGGAAWSADNLGLPNVAVFGVAIQNASRTLRIATHGRGMYEQSVDVSSLTPTATATNTSTSTSTATATPTGTTTGTATSTATSTPTGTATSTATATPTGTATSTATSTPTGTATSTATNPPTGTATGNPTTTATGIVTSAATGTPTAATTSTSTTSATTTTTATTPGTATSTTTATATPPATTTSTPPMRPIYIPIVAVGP